MANPGYWNRRRGPRLKEVVFRNDLSAQRALDLVCDGEGEVDLVTEVDPGDAERVERSEHAELVSVDAMRALVGIIDRDSERLPLADRRARQALNLAVDRTALVREAMFGHARPLAGLTPPTALTVAHRLPRRLAPYPFDPRLAVELWRAAGGTGGRALRIAAPERFARVARHVAGNLRAALGLRVDIALVGLEEQRVERRRLAERARPRSWDVLLLEQTTQAADTPPHELHRAFVGAHGEYRAGPEVPEFDSLYAELERRTSQLQLLRQSNRIDSFVREQALALFLCAPDSLYAVNRHVHFKPYRTTFELAEASVGHAHWSRRSQK